MLILMVALLAEFVVPQAVSYAEARKAYQISSGQALQTAQGMWLRNGNHIIHIDMYGQNSSMNVVQATNIALYEMTKQLL